MAELAVRPARAEDVDAVRGLGRRVFEGEAMTAWARHHLEAHLDAFPEGQLVAALDGDLVASSTSLRVPREAALAPHTWMSLTGGCELVNHDPQGDVLYGLELVVDPRRRGLGVGQLVYRARKVLARELDLWGIAIGGRMPGFREALARSPGLTAERYAEQVAAGRRRDPVLGPQLAAGFRLEGVLENYVVDPASRHHAALMTWRS